MIADLLLSVFATFRLSHLLAEESGPYRMFVQLRTHPALPDVAKEALSCKECNSVWIALGCTLWLCLWKRVPWSLAWLTWLGISGGAHILNKVVK